MTAMRRGRPAGVIDAKRRKKLSADPKELREAEDEAEKARENAALAQAACAKARAALGRNYERAAARILLRTVKEVVAAPNARLRGTAGYADLAKCAAEIQWAFHHSGRPSPQALAELMTWLLADNRQRYNEDNPPYTVRRRKLIEHLAKASEPTKVTAAVAKRVAGVDWKTAKDWLANQEVQQEAAELRRRLSNPYESWARDAHKAASQLDAFDVRQSHRTPVEVAREALKPTDNE